MVFYPDQREDTQMADGNITKDILYDAVAQRRAASPVNIIGGAVLCSFALALLYFVSKTVVK